MWPVNCNKGRLKGQDWLDFLNTYSLDVGKIIVFTYDMCTSKVHVLKFGAKDVEEIFPWY